MIQFPTLSVMQKNRAAVAAELRRLLPKMEGFRTAKPLPIGVSAIDSHLPDGGLHGGALHEIVPEDGGAPAAVGFMVALLARLYSPPQPNSGVPEFGQYQSDRSRKHPTSIGEGLGVGVVPPPPIVEEGEDLPARTSRPDPPPYPPPQGGREKRKIIFVLSGYGAGQYGRPYGHGLSVLGLDPARVILVETAQRNDALWAMEEALRSGAPAAVAGAIDKLDLKLSQRLHLAAVDAGLPLFLLRPGEMLEASAAATRWRVGPAPATRDRFGLFLRPRWHLLLERCRNGRAGEWTVEYDHVAHRFSLAAALADPAFSRGAGEKAAARSYRP